MSPPPQQQQTRTQPGLLRGCQSPTTMPTKHFDLTVLGSSGGPLEGITSSFLLKPATLSYAEILDHRISDALIAIDCGSGLGKLTDIISDELHGCPGRVTRASLQHYASPLDVGAFTAPSQHRSEAISCTSSRTDGASAVEVAFEISELIKSYLITHAHMDHIGALVINSPAFGHDSGKHIYALTTTIDALQEYVFNDHIWPNLSSRKNGTFLDFVALENQNDHVINSRYTVRPFRINHGCVSDGTNYDSTAYLITETASTRKILTFGDVEADSYSHENHNIEIWKHVAPYIKDGTLRTIVIECSTANLPAGEPLFGHLTPDALFSEILKLRSTLMEIGHVGELKDVNFLITHVKERRTKENPRITILNELNALKKQHKLRCEFSMILPGLTYSVE